MKNATRSFGLTLLATSAAAALGAMALAQQGTGTAPPPKEKPAANSPGNATAPAEKAKPAGKPSNKGGVVVGEAAPEWSLKDLEGKPLALKDLRGKVVLMDFWATWCPPCRAVMPELQKMHEELGDKGLVVLGMNAWEGRGKLTSEEANSRAIKFKKDNKYTYSGALQADDAAKAYGVTGIPAMFAVGPDGKIIGQWVGADAPGIASMKATVKKAVDDLAKAKPAEGTGTAAPEKKSGG